MSEIRNVEGERFDQEVLKSDRPVLVDFWAAWCGPCQRQAPVLEELSRRRGDVKVVKVDVDRNQDLAAAYGIQSIPTLLLFRDGEPAEARIGLQSLEDLEALAGAPAAEGEGR